MPLIDFNPYSLQVSVHRGLYSLPSSPTLLYGMWNVTFQSYPTLFSLIAFISPDLFHICSGLCSLESKLYKSLDLDFCVEFLGPAIKLNTL